MRRYILFSEEEIEELSKGHQIKHNISDIGEVYFMSRQQFIKGLSEDNPDEEE